MSSLPFPKQPGNEGRHTWDNVHIAVLVFVDVQLGSIAGEVPVQIQVSILILQTLIIIGTQQCNTLCKVSHRNWLVHLIRCGKRGEGRRGEERRGEERRGEEMEVKKEREINKKEARGKENLDEFYMNKLYIPLYITRTFHN